MTNRAQKIFDFMNEQTSAGRTVYLQTRYRTTAVKKRHMPQVRVRAERLEIQHGKRWIDYTWIDRVTAGD